jgi:DNA-binding PadR family transcriptional regulator
LIIAADHQPADDADDERRQYYALTSFGREVLRAEVQRLEKLVKLARTKEALTR